MRSDYMFSKILIIIEYIFVGLVISVGISLPYYYIVYRFVDGCIEEVPVSSTEYYTVKE